MTKHKTKMPQVTVSDMSSDVKRFMEDLQEETDRGVALAGAAFLDDVLAAMLRAALVAKPKAVDELLGHRGPVETFAARTNLAYCMGLIGDKMYRDLWTARKIRNEFAHSHTPVSFDDPRVAELCENLSVASFLQQVIIMTRPRHRFITDVILLANQMMLRGLSLKHTADGADFRYGEVVRV